jgi:hypothetical protein
MVNRPAGGARSKKWEKSEFDWYVEPPRAVEQLLDGIDFGDDLIWDPCCGKGTVLDVAKAWGHPTVGSDLVNRFPRHRFFRGNILSQVATMPTHPGRQTSIVCNPPYSYEDNIAERVITHCLENYPVRRAAFILPVAFLNSQDRWGSTRLLRLKPSHVCFYRERHSMPPGHMIDTMANPFGGGMQDYCAIVWTRPHRWRTEAVWLRPGHQVPKQR